MYSEPCQKSTMLKAISYDVKRLKAVYYFRKKILDNFKGSEYVSNRPKVSENLNFIFVVNPPYSILYFSFKVNRVIVSKKEACDFSCLIRWYIRNFKLRIRKKHDTERPKYRSSRSEVFCKKSVLRNFAKFTGKHLCQILFFTKGYGLQLY